MGVRLRLDDPDLVESLTSFLERRECAVDRVGAHTLEGFNAVIDPGHRKLVGAGPIVAASVHEP